MLAVAEQALQGFIQRPHGAMEIDGAEQLALDLHKPNKRVEASLMDCQAPLAEETVA